MQEKKGLIFGLFKECQNNTDMNCMIVSNVRWTIPLSVDKCGFWIVAATDNFELEL